MQNSSFQQLSITAMAQFITSQILREGSTAIDATCGNGADTLFLAKCVGSFGSVLGIDVQQLAIENTQLLLDKHQIKNTQLVREGHENIVSICEQFAMAKPQAILYNLGYLPGANKELTTQSSTTIQSVHAATELIVQGGIISICCYPGHSAGNQETQEVLQLCDSLRDTFLQYQYTNPTVSTAPILRVLLKK